MGGFWSHKSAPTPGRQKKIDIVKPLLEARHYKFRELVSGGGRWYIHCHLRAEAIPIDEHYGLGMGEKIEAETFDELVAILRDDLAYARHIHRARGAGLHDRIESKRRDYRSATNTYGDYFTHLIRAQIEDQEGEMPRIRESILEWEKKATDAFDAIAVAEQAAADYDATIPATPEEAAAYLASLKRVGQLEEERKARWAEISRRVAGREPTTS